MSLSISLWTVYVLGVAAGFGLGYVTCIFLTARARLKSEAALKAVYKRPTSVKISGKGVKK